MKNFRANLKNTGKEFRSFIVKHKAVSIIIGAIVVIIVVRSALPFHHGRGFGRFGGEEGMMGREGLMMGDDFGGKGGPMMGGENMPPEMRLFDRVCESGSIKDATGFMQKFRPGVEKRDQGKDMVKKHLEKVIEGLKDKGYDTTNLEEQMKTVDAMFAQFQSGSQDFQVNPQEFCTKQQEWKDLNIKMKSIMTGFFEEIEKAEEQVNK